MAIAKAALAAMNRFGLGATARDATGLHDPRGWLLDQIDHHAVDDALFAGLPSSLEYRDEAARLHMVRRAIDNDNEGPYRFRFAGLDFQPAQGREGIAELSAYRDRLLAGRQQGLHAEARARYASAISTSAPFIERLVWFWSNHFAVSVDKFLALPFAGPMEREAIRPHVTGRFSDLLLAVETHPAMQLYLDNFRSVGEGSATGRRVKAGTAGSCETDEGQATGMNENLGREILELHTVGVDGGYAQDDVIELSRAITGWSVPFPCDFASGDRPREAFLYRQDAHEPGPRRVLGQRFEAGGFQQGGDVLSFLARRPETARFLAVKLARHLVCDDPPESLVKRMAMSYLEQDTDLSAMYRTVVNSDEAWQEERARKFRSPQDFVVAAVRAAGIGVDGAQMEPLLELLSRLGQPLWEPRNPAGFSDREVAWISGDALWKRLQAATALAARVPSDAAPPHEMAQLVLGPFLDADTTQAIQRAESVQAAYATLFSSPAFQWRI